MISFYTFFNSRPEWDYENVYTTGVLAVIKKISYYRWHFG